MEMMNDSLLKTARGYGEAERSPTTGHVGEARQHATHADQ
jgi:hypothetical protein